MKLDIKTYDCMVWKISGIPSKHTKAVIIASRRHGHQFVHNYLLKDACIKTYSNVIHLIPHQSFWPEMTFNKVLPLGRKNLSGRPKKKKEKKVQMNKPKRRGAVVQNVVYVEHLDIMS
ncbi:hypothetical protein ACOSQ2_023820 [Xanthoceras sorbifolium]